MMHLIKHMFNTSMIPYISLDQYLNPNLYAIPNMQNMRFFCCSVYILNKSENATLQLSIFYEKVLDKRYLLKLNNVAQTSSKRFVETPPIRLI